MARSCDADACEFQGYVKVASLHVLQKCGFKISGEDKFSDENGEEIEEIILKLE